MFIHIYRIKQNVIYNSYFLQVRHLVYILVRICPKTPSIPLVKSFMDDSLLKLLKLMLDEFLTVLNRQLFRYLESDLANPNMLESAKSAPNLTT